MADLLPFIDSQILIYSHINSGFLALQGGDLGHFCRTAQALRILAIVVPFEVCSVAQLRVRGFKDELLV